MLIASPSPHIFGGRPSKMSTVLAHAPNCVVSCAQLSVGTTSRTLQIGASGKARMATMVAIP